MGKSSQDVQLSKRIADDERKAAEKRARSQSRAIPSRQSRRQAATRKQPARRSQPIVTAPFPIRTGHDAVTAASAQMQADTAGGPPDVSVEASREKIDLLAAMLAGAPAVAAPPTFMPPPACPAPGSASQPQAACTEQAARLGNAHGRVGSISWHSVCVVKC